MAPARGSEGKAVENRPRRAKVLSSALRSERYSRLPSRIMLPPRVRGEKAKPKILLRLQKRKRNVERSKGGETEVVAADGDGGSTCIILLSRSPLRIVRRRRGRRRRSPASNFLGDLFCTKKKPLFFPAGDPSNACEFLPSLPFPSLCLRRKTVESPGPSEQKRFPSIQPFKRKISPGDCGRRPSRRRRAR